MFEIVFLSSPAVSGVFSSVQEAKKAMNALMIYLQRYLEKENIEKVRTECVVSCTSSHTGEEVSPHLHILIMAVNHVFKIANAVIEYLSSRHSSVKNPAKGLRIYKTFHDAGNYANLHRYLQKQARYQRAFEKNFGEYLESYLMEGRILQIDNPKTGIDYQDDFSRALNIERAQLLLNEEKKRCEFYQLQHQNEIFENPVLLGPEECDVISAYENGLERVCIYFPEVVRYSIEDESFNEENYFSEETEICDCFPDDESTSICTENPTTEDVSGTQRDEIVLDETDSSGISTPVYDENRMLENILGSQRDEIVLDETDSSGIFAPVCDETQTTENVSGNERNEFELDETESSGISAPVYAENLKQKRKTRSSHDRGSILWHMKNQINILKKKLKLLSPLVKIRLQNQKIQE